jgi:asparagine synthetase B (glutamine-hydrolysing)
VARAADARRRTPALAIHWDGAAPDDALLDELVEGVDEPVVDPAAVAWWAMARAAGDAGCAALLSGVGGAELFGGPPAYRAQRAAGLPGAGLLGRALGADASWARRQLRWRGTDDVPEAAWADVDALAAAAPGHDPAGNALWLDRQLLAEGTLAVLDRACAAHGLVSRAPFADPDLVSLVATIPVGHVLQVRRPRGLFEEAMAERLPSPVPAHAPMDVPVAAWLGLVHVDVAERLEGLVAGDEVRRVLAGGPASARRAWALGMLARWRAR